MANDDIHLCKVHPELLMYRPHVGPCSEDHRCCGTVLCVSYRDHFWDRLNAHLIPHTMRDSNDTLVKGYVCDLDAMLNPKIESAINTLAQIFPDYKEDIAFGGRQRQVYIMPALGGYDILSPSTDALNKLARGETNLAHKKFCRSTTYTVDLINRGVLRLRKPFNVCAIMDTLCGTKFRLDLTPCNVFNDSVTQSADTDITPGATNNQASDIHAQLRQPDLPQQKYDTLLITLLAASCYNNDGYYITTTIMHPGLIKEFNSAVLITVNDAFCCRVIKIGGKIYHLERLAECIPEKIHILNDGTAYICNTQYVMEDPLKKLKIYNVFNEPKFDTAVQVAELPVWTGVSPLTDSVAMMDTINTFRKIVTNGGPALTNHPIVPRIMALFNRIEHDLQVVTTTINPGKK